MSYFLNPWRPNISLVIHSILLSLFQKFNFNYLFLYPRALRDYCLSTRRTFEQFDFSHWRPTFAKYFYWETARAVSTIHRKIATRVHPRSNLFSKRSVNAKEWRWKRAAIDDESSTTGVRRTSCFAFSFSSVCRRVSVGCPVSSRRNEQRSCKWTSIYTRE